MIRLGLSVYPEQERPEEIEAYLKKGRDAGFDKVFTSLFSVDGTREEIIEYFKNFTRTAHRLGYEVVGDCNPVFFEKMNASFKDLSVFKEMGMDVLRMDSPFYDERDAVLVNNPCGLKIEFNTSMIEPIENALKNGADPSRISTCHNFYPLRWTCPSLEAVNAANEYWKKRGLEVSMFLTSQQKGTHGPWPVSDGLPTIEEHRDLPVEVQLKHMLAMKNVDTALIGNAWASDQEFEALSRTLKNAFAVQGSKIPLPQELEFVRPHLPEGTLLRIPFSLHPAADLSEAEKKLLFEFPLHSDLGDCLNYLLRSRWTRFVSRKTPIVPRACSKAEFEKGDVVIVNDNCRHYAGEVQIVLKPFVNDGTRNFAGTIDPAEHMILDHMGANDFFTFLPGEPK